MSRPTDSKIGTPEPSVPATPTTEPPTENGRLAPRRRMLKKGLIAYSGRHLTIRCMVRDLSDTGARLTITDPLSAPDTFELIVELDGLEADCVVAWRRGMTLGVRFTAPPRYVEPKRGQFVDALVVRNKLTLRRKPVIT